MALWAVKVAKSREASSKYTYGWQRAEILGALINSVFLIALCMTIFLEAIQRFVQVPVISNPQLILVVGLAGLLSNIVGLFLFHEHGHSHGGHISEEHSGHTHSHGGVTSEDIEREAEQWANSHTHSTSTERIIDDTTSICEAVPEAVLKTIGESTGLLDGQQPNYSSTDTESDHPGPKQFVQCEEEAREIRSYHGRRQSVSSITHQGHFHVKPRAHVLQKSLNMEGVFLHVLGDALGNIGVIITAIFIWKTDFPWKYYMDPVTSLIITGIITSSALPLFRRTSAILLQGVPQSVDADEVRDDIASLPGVIDIHDLHIWILSENLNVATLHVSVSEGPEDFMKLAQRIRTCMRGHGIDSTTIQPEFLCFRTDSASSSSSRQSYDQALDGPPACVLQGNKSSGGLSKVHCNY